MVDTNLLILLYIGSISEDLIENFERTSTFIKKDYHTLIGILNNFKVIATLPNILTEVNNLMNKLKGKYKEDFYTKFSKSIKELNEEYVKSSKLVETDEFYKYGLTDTAIYSLKNKYLLLTNELPLYQYFQKNKLDAINFNNIRYHFW